MDDQTGLTCSAHQPMGSRQRALELAKRIAGAVNHQDNPLMSDAKEVSRALLELAGQREPVKPAPPTVHNSWWHCGKCGESLGVTKSMKFCSECGQAVVWEKAGGK